MQDAYGCVCGKELQAKDILFMHQDGDELVVIVECSHRKRERQRKLRYPYDQRLLNRLLGRSDDDPEGEGSEGEAPSPESAHEVMMERFAWEMGQVDSAHDFLLFCRGPQYLDAEIREQFRRKHGSPKQ